MGAQLVKEVATKHKMLLEMVLQLQSLLAQANYKRRGGVKNVAAVQTQ